MTKRPLTRPAVSVRPMSPRKRSAHGSVMPRGMGVGLPQGRLVAVNQRLPSGPRVTRFRPFPDTLDSVIVPTGAAAVSTIAGLTPARAAMTEAASSRQFRTTS